MPIKKRQPILPTKAALAPRKQFIFRLVALALPIVVVGVAEIALRIGGYGGYPPMLQKVGPVPGGSLVIADQGGASSWFFASPHLTGRNEQSAFLDPKPANTVRIFCVGESAMQGYPQPRHLASSAFLQKMLEDVWPAQNVEILNLGTTAIASFPVLGILTEALEFQPDLMVVYTGNNEFFGTYGVASAGRAGGRPWMLQANRFLYSLAMVQGLRQLLRSDGADFNRTLMETMMAQHYIGPDDWRRSAAAHTLQHNLVEMIRRCRARGVPVLICTLPANERGLAPIGNDKLDELSPEVRNEFKSLIATAETKLAASDFESALPTLQRALRLCPKHARAHFLLGQGFTQMGKFPEALEQFVAARDADTMPWRPPSLTQDAVLRAARDENAPVCDLAAAFRGASPGGAIGWELMDDHVHPNLRGQALIAESIANSLCNFDNGLRISPEARAGLSPWTDYARRLGENPYDRFGVAHNLRVLFDAAFMRANNSQVFERFNTQATGIENQMSPDVRAAMREWQAAKPFAGARCPITAAVAQVLVNRDEYQQALELYQIARQDVPQYTSWYLEYTYFVLYCKQKLHGPLEAADRIVAKAAIRQGHFLSHPVVSENGFVERYTGLLHLLCNEFAEAIPCLLACREKQTGFDRVVVDQTLVVCYLQTRQFARARELLTAGVAGGGEHAGRYETLLAKLPALEKALTAQTNSTDRPRD